MFSEIQVFKCFLCAYAANDVGGGPPQELDAKQLVAYKKLARGVSASVFRCYRCAVNRLVKYSCLYA